VRRVSSSAPQVICATFPPQEMAETDAFTDTLANAVADTVADAIANDTITHDAFADIVPDITDTVADVINNDTVA